jgi:hypothetical protein
MFHQESYDITSINKNIARNIDQISDTAKQLVGVAQAEFIVPGEKIDGLAVQRFSDSSQGIQALWGFRRSDYNKYNPAFAHGNSFDERMVITLSRESITVALGHRRGIRPNASFVRGTQRFVRGRDEMGNVSDDSHHSVRLVNPVEFTHIQYIDPLRPVANYSPLTAEHVETFAREFDQSVALFGLDLVARTALAAAR